MKKIEIFKVFPKGGALGKIDGKIVFVGHNRSLNLKGKEGTIIFEKRNREFTLEETDKGLKVNLYGDYNESDFLEGEKEVNYIKNI